jgi:acetyl-CoA C-acetyltransferase
MAKLRAVFIRRTERSTAGNASGINDAAAGRRADGEVGGGEERAEGLWRVLVSYGHAGNRSEDHGARPGDGGQARAAKGWLKLEQMDTIESNEAFAAQALGVSKELGMDPAKVNPERRRGRARPSDRRDRRDPHDQGDVRAQRTGGRYGLITMCIGGGQGIAAIIERM